MSISQSSSSPCANSDRDTQAATSSTSQAPYCQHSEIDDNSADVPKSRTLDIMNEMPNDILLEIFSHVEPIDLFHVSRTTKALRDLITRSNSIFVWRRVYNSENGTKKPPPCPEDINPIRYSNLLFGRNCQVCGSINGDVVHWTGRLRFCVECAGAQLREFYPPQRDPIIPLCIPWHIKPIRDFQGGFFVLEVEYLQHSRRLEECKDEEARFEYKRQANITNVWRQRLGLDLSLWASDL